MDTNNRKYIESGKLPCEQPLVLDRMRCIYCGKHLNFVRKMSHGHSIIDGYVHENREDKLACHKARAEANVKHEPRCSKE